MVGICVPFGMRVCDVNLPWDPLHSMSLSPLITVATGCRRQLKSTVSTFVKLGNSTVQTVDSTVRRKGNCEDGWQAQVMQSHLRQAWMESLVVSKLAGFWSVGGESFAASESAEYLEDHIFLAIYWHRSKDICFYQRREDKLEAPVQDISCRWLMVSTTEVHQDIHFLWYG